jgi:hypothetical protein
MSLAWRFHRLSLLDRLLLLEAVVSLGAAAFCVRVFPFRVAVRCGSFHIHRREPSQEERDILVKRIRWAVQASARRVPWRAMCFQQGLAAQSMLGRRGIPSVLHYGVAPDHDHGISAHVWVCNGGLDVIGCEIAHLYATLGIFPAPVRDDP